MEIVCLNPKYDMLSQFHNGNMYRTISTDCSYPVTSISLLMTELVPFCITYPTHLTQSH